MDDVRLHATSGLETLDEPAERARVILRSVVGHAGQTTLTSVEEVTDATFADEVLASPLPVIVDFWAPWCKPCEAIEPHLAGIAEDQAERVRLVRMNVDQNLAVPSRYGVLSLPTVMLFSGGDARVTVHGARSREHYEQAFARVLQP
jgi:thioredoxin 1